MPQFPSQKYLQMSEISGAVKGQCNLLLQEWVLGSRECQQDAGILRSYMLLQGALGYPPPMRGRKLY